MWPLIIVVHESWQSADFLASLGGFRASGAEGLGFRVWGFGWV